MRTRLNLALIVGVLITLALIGGCYPTQAPPEGGGGWTTTIIFMLLIFAFFYFVIIRPQRKRQKEHQKLIEGLKKGDKIITAGGIYGQIESLSEDSVVIEVESGVTIRVARGSIVLKREK